MFHRSLVAVSLLLSMVTASCVTKTEDLRTHTVSFKVTTVSHPAGCTGDQADPCPFSMDNIRFVFSIEALQGNGERAVEYNGTAIISLVPAGILPTPAEDQNVKKYLGQNVYIATLTEGIAENVEVDFHGAFGKIQFIVEDIGYTPSIIPLECVTNGTNCPPCFNQDPLPSGCFSADDLDPSSGTGAAGVSDDLYFENPSIAQIQQVESVDEISNSPLEGFRITVDGNSPEDVGTFEGCIDNQGNVRELLVVTAVTNDGFNITDVCNNGGPFHSPDTWWQFASVYAYNFNTPENLFTGDCITFFQGGAEEFFGFTELKNPAWSDPVCLDEECTPACVDLTPPPVLLTAAMIRNDFTMEMLEAAVVAVEDAVVGHGLACDTNGNGSVDWEIDEERDCYYDCSDDPSCWSLESYSDYFQYTVNVNGAEIAVVTRGIVNFDPLENEGSVISYIAGTIKHLDFGGPPWILQPRNEEDFQR